MSGHSQEIFSGLSRLAACCPGQNGSSVCPEESTSPDRSCSCAVTGYTPNTLIPAVLTPNEVLHATVPPGGTRAEMRNGCPTASKPEAMPSAR